LSTENMTELQRVVLAVIAAAASVPPEELDPDRDVFELGLDSIDFWSILMDVEEEVGEEVPSEVLDRLSEIDGEVTVRRLLGVVSAWGSTGTSQHRPL
jgi:acyl carrier protein